MANPRKRKGGQIIGNVLNKGGTAVESSFTQAELQNLLEIGLFGHDGDGGFVQGGVGSLRKDGQGSLAEDAGLEDFATLNSSRMGGTTDWHLSAARYYLTNVTTEPGMSSATKATDDSGVLHCPAGPDAQTVPKLEDVSNGSAVSFYLKPTTWGAGRSLRFYIENTDADTDINFRNADDNSSITTQSGVKAAGTYVDIDRSTANDADGIEIRVTSAGTGTTALAGWQVAWENRPA